MRTTLDIDDDILLAAKALARDRQTSAGKVISELARKGLTRPVSFKARNGIPQLPVRPDGGIVTLDLVNRLRDEDP